MKIPQEAVATALDEIILKGEHPECIKVVEDIARLKKITMYEVMENIMKDLKLTSYEAIFKALHR
jgi:hypothetical protein